MLIGITPHAIAALRKAVALLDVIPEGSLVEIKTDSGRVVVMVITDPDGRAPECAEMVFAAAFDMRSAPAAAAV